MATNKELIEHVAGRDSPLSHGWYYEFFSKSLKELLEGKRQVGMDEALDLPIILPQK